jgi:RNA polymerase-binding transcription factor DksA
MAWWQSLFRSPNSKINGDAYEDSYKSECLNEEQKMKRNNRLTQKDIQEFKASLLARRSELLSDVVSMESEVLRKGRSDLSNLPIHFADVGTDSFATENTLGLVESERKLIADIDDALDRIENGTYGLCEVNGKPIPKARLRVIPWARYCVEHARLSEKGFLPNQDLLIESFLSDDTDEDQDEDSI